MQKKHLPAKKCSPAKKVIACNFFVPAICQKLTSRHSKLRFENIISIA
jgi:hypothetical protein